jgi:hypothetical protein
VQYREVVKIAVKTRVKPRDACNYRSLSSVNSYDTQRHKLIKNLCGRIRCMNQSSRRIALPMSPMESINHANSGRLKNRLEQEAVHAI